MGGVWGVGRNQLAILGKVWAVAPLYYPDTLVNPDTCLGSIIIIEISGG